MSETPGIGEKALNKAAEIGLSSQLDEVDNLEVNIQTEPLKLIQEEVEQVHIAGEGLVMVKLYICTMSSIKKIRNFHRN
jgi:hypothetical protein